MKIYKIEGKNIRVHDEFKYDLDPNLNVFYGKKRIGKTSLLYSLELLFTQNNQLGRMIKHDREFAEVSALVKAGTGGRRKVYRRIGDKPAMTLSNEKITLPKLLDAFETHEYFSKAFVPSKVFNSLSKRDRRRIFLSGFDLPDEMLDGPLDVINSKISLKKERIGKLEAEVKASRENLEQAEMYSASKDDVAEAERIEGEIRDMEKKKDSLNRAIDNYITKGKTFKKQSQKFEEDIRELHREKEPLLKELGESKASAEISYKHAQELHKKGYCPVCGNKDVNGPKHEKKDEYFEHLNRQKGIEKVLDSMEKTLEELTSKKMDVDRAFEDVRGVYDGKNKEVQLVMEKIGELREELKVYRNEAQGLADILKEKFAEKEKFLKEEAEDLEMLREEKRVLIEERIRDMEKTLEENYKTFFFKEVKFYLTKTSKEGVVSDDFQITYDGTIYDDLSGSESIMAELEFSTMISDVVIIDQLERLGDLEDLDILRRYAVDKDVQIIGTWVGSDEGSDDIKLIS